MLYSESAREEYRDIVQPNNVHPFDVGGDCWDATDQGYETRLLTDALFMPDDYLKFSVFTGKWEQGSCNISHSLFCKKKEIMLSFEHIPKELTTMVGTWDKDMMVGIHINPFSGPDHEAEYRYAVATTSGMNAADYHQLTKAIEKRDLPVAAVLWDYKDTDWLILRVDAKNRTEYEERLNLLKKVFNRETFRLTIVNKDPDFVLLLPNSIYGFFRYYMLIAAVKTDFCWEDWERNYYTEKRKQDYPVEYAKRLVAEMKAPAIDEALLKKKTLESQAEYYRKKDWLLTVDRNIPHYSGEYGKRAESVNDADRQTLERWMLNHLLYTYMGYSGLIKRFAHQPNKDRTLCILRYGLYEAVRKVNPYLSDECARRIEALRDAPGFNPEDFGGMD